MNDPSEATADTPSRPHRKSWEQWAENALVGAGEVSAATATAGGLFQLATGKGTAEALRVAKIGAGIGAFGSFGIGNFMYDQTFGRAGKPRSHVEREEARRDAVQQHVCQK